MLAAFVLSGCSFTSSIKQAQPVAENFLRQMQAHRFGSAYNLVSPTAQKASPAQIWQKDWQTIEQKQGVVQGWHLHSFRVSTEYADLHYQLHCAKGTAMYSFRLVPVDSQWRINGARSQY
ncbi:MAG TPA: hypothetical protein VF600_14400 [Abditibacteriaceae bacterium]